MIFYNHQSSIFAPLRTIFWSLFGMSATLSFMEILKSAYNKQRQLLRDNPLRYQCVSSVRQKNKQRKQSRTKSKSRKKKTKTSHIQSRQSLRNIPNISQIDYVELEKQPLWQPKRKKKKQANRKNYNPSLRHIGPAREQINELYEFYSPEVNQEQLSEVEENQDQIQQKAVGQSDKNNPTQLIELNINQQMVDVSQKHIENEDNFGQWKPSKQQQSQLAIQVIIDEYIMFKSNMRGSEQARVAQLINYIREIKGYYFNISVLHNILTNNPQLYQILILGSEKYIRCLSKKLTPDVIEKRMHATKKNMYLCQMKTTTD